MAFQTTQTDGFSNRVLSFYNKQLLQAIQLNLRLSNYARQQAVPKSTGFNGIRFSGRGALRALAWVRWRKERYRQP